MKSDVGDVECLIKSHEFTAIGQATSACILDRDRGASLRHGDTGSDRVVAAAMAR